MGGDTNWSAYLREKADSLSGQPNACFPLGAGDARCIADEIKTLRDEVDRSVATIKAISKGANAFAEKNHELHQEIARLSADLKKTSGTAVTFRELLQSCESENQALLASVKECPWFTDWMDADEEERAKERCSIAIARSSS